MPQRQGDEPTKDHRQSRREPLPGGLARPVLLFAMAAVIALAVSACGDSDDSATQDPGAVEEADTGETERPPADEGPSEQPPTGEGDGEDANGEATGGPDGAETALCANDSLGYAIEYPADWHANSGEVAPACSHFDPVPFEVPEATELRTAVNVSVEPVPFDRVTEAGPEIEVEDSERLQVAGRQALARETVTTGEGLFPEGTRAYEYLVDMNGETMILSTYDVEEFNYEVNRTVLDELVETLTISS